MNKLSPPKYLNGNKNFQVKVILEHEDISQIGFYNCMEKVAYITVYI